MNGADQEKARKEREATQVQLGVLHTAEAGDVFGDSGSDNEKKEKMANNGNT